MTETNVNQSIFMFSKGPESFSMRVNDEASLHPDIEKMVKAYESIKITVFEVLERKRTPKGYKKKLAVSFVNYMTNVLSKRDGISQRSKRISLNTIWDQYSDVLKILKEVS